MKQYKAIFFDWDGTAVLSRKAPVEEAVSAMAPLLEKGVKLAIISGTTYENIAGGRIESFFKPKQLNHLYLGLGRGAYNYAFENGRPYVFADTIPDKDTLLNIHRVCFDIHLTLKERRDFDTDIVFTRPNYCKIDLMVNRHRGDSLFMQANELEQLKICLAEHGIRGGLEELRGLAIEAGKRYGLRVIPTCDAKYLEVGISSKSSNTDAIFDRLRRETDLKAEECSFWGDEYVGIEPGIYGSDSFMRTPATVDGDFFDVSDVPGERPEGVRQLGGGIQTFLNFLKTQ